MQSDQPNRTPTAAMIEAGAIAIFAAQFGPEPAMIHAGAKDWHNFGEAVHDEFRRAANMAYRAMEAARAKPT